MATEDVIKTYLKDTFENQNLSNCEVTVTGTNDQTEGFGSYITFAVVSGTAKDGTTKNINTAIKISRENLLKKYRKAYEREAYIYSTVFPRFTTFQKENKVKNIFTSFPKCYRIISDEKLFVEIVILEDLKKRGYVLYDRKKPLDLDHLKLVLREYGNFHAISFAFRHKKKEDFKKLVSNFDDVMIDIIDGSLAPMLRNTFQKVCGTLKEIDRPELYEICNDILVKGAGEAMKELLKVKEPQSAILHGDCWNNNFLYKYEQTGTPTEVAILDWQISRVHSPVVDLSYFMYSTSSKEQLQHFDELLEIYYNSFSTTVKELGCDPEELFSFSALKDHWKKYSLYGVFMLVFSLHVILSDKEELPSDFEGNEDGTDFSDVKITNRDEYIKRLVAVLSHYHKYSST
ncbi:hypothetical protein NQ315_009637 [Exocentrus adspersus]|uniref:CHK kinase-like domain-containing protein n=1 Tax=Exocentrus adspersus TaxID=1586481 RepID=A0AAV8WGU5_9CUCU|nr:hypothetical protein NQ315_009637 [Exocentrus adspersus]